jgi:methionyl-tRNA formyltransferase
MNIIICTIKSWNIKEAYHFKEKYESKHNIMIISNKNDLNYEKLQLFKPDYIFFPHWSYIIPDNICDNWNCIVFHMTDLPFGRGGSPLQNLIVRNIKETKISALKVSNILDGGPVYLKENLNLNGTAEEIYLRASKIIFHIMIPQMINNDIVPVEQKGEIVTFKRRTAEDSLIDSNMNLEQIYDYIRMLDGEGYPKAYIQFGKYKLEFSRASLKHDSIIADIRIVEGNDE